MTPDYNDLAKKEIERWYEIIPETGGYYISSGWQFDSVKHLENTIKVAAQAQQDIIDALVGIFKTFETEKRSMYGYYNREIEEQVNFHQQLKEAILNYKI